MKDVCICFVKTTKAIHSVGINDGNGRYYSEEGGGYFDISRNTDILEYMEMDWKGLRLLIEKGINCA